MNILPDTINGALILSVVDFILSFIFISFIGIILHCLLYTSPSPRDRG